MFTLDEVKFSDNQINVFKKKAWAQKLGLETALNALVSNYFLCIWQISLLGHLLQIKYKHWSQALLIARV